VLILPQRAETFAFADLDRLRSWRQLRAAHQSLFVMTILFWRLPWRRAEANRALTAPRQPM
jgi:hypothetical protein